ncbi:MAG: hypothetical protein ABIH42_06300, partial [Planctomycetota bacterium]
MTISRIGKLLLCILTTMICSCFLDNMTDDVVDNNNNNNNNNNNGTSTNKLAGKITYIGSEDGTHDLFVGFSTEPMGDGNIVKYENYTDINKYILQAGYAYEMTNVPAGTYYLSAYWDIEETGELPESSNAIGCIGSITNPTTITVTDSTIRGDLNITLQDVENIGHEMVTI